MIGGRQRMDGAGTRGWVLLSYAMPREPSTPRITVWRKLKRLGVAQLGSGVVALPADARTREHLEWVAEEILEASGSAMVWSAAATNPEAERELAASMAAARAQEYRQIIAEANAASGADPSERASSARRLRAEWHRVHRRDYFPPPEREAARQAIQHLADASTRTAVDDAPATSASGTGSTAAVAPPRPGSAAPASTRRGAR